MERVKFVNRDNLRIARENVGLDTLSASRKISQSKGDLVFAFESGDLLPTWPQIAKLAKIYEIPELIFLSESAIEKNKIIPDYRIGQALENDEKIKKLINFVIKRQKWLKRNIGAEMEKNRLQGSGKYLQNPRQLAEAIKEKLEIGLDEIKNISGADSRKKTLNYLIGKAESRGIFVGKTISYHKIGVSDMRGLYISDDYYPFIIINRKDAVSAQIFSFVHELAHLFRKTESVSNSLEFRQTDGSGNNEEIFCNKTAVELLLPAADFGKEFYGLADIDNMSEIYKVSKLAIFYRLKSLNKIRRDQSGDIENKIKEESKKNLELKNNKKNKGGNYINSMRDSNGNLFNKTIAGLYYENKINYTEASSLLNFSVEKTW
jgi:Zn-dependent peptidase ImmA (M78 family)